MSQPTTWGCPRIADAPQTPEQVADRTDDSLDALLSSHSGVAVPAYGIKGTVWHSTSNDQVFSYDGSNSRQIAVNVGAPASAAATGVAGDVAWDTQYFYICSATNTWIRVALATWV